MQAILVWQQRIELMDLGRASEPILTVATGGQVHRFSRVRENSDLMTDDVYALYVESHLQPKEWMPHLEEWRRDNPGILSIR